MVTEIRHRLKSSLASAFFEIRETMISSMLFFLIER